MSPLRNREMLALLGHPALKPEDQIELFGVDGRKSLGTVETLRNTLSARDPDEWFVGADAHLTIALVMSPDTAGGVRVLRMSDPLP